MDPVLYGSNTEERIVAVQHLTDTGMRCYTRDGNSLTAFDHEFYPFFHLSDRRYLQDYPARHWVKELSGDNFYRYLCAFGNWRDMWDGVRHVLGRYNSEQHTQIDSYLELPILHLRPDAVAQFLLQTGRTLFKGMEYGDLYRVQLDIETYWKPGRRSEATGGGNDRIIVIALSDNRGWHYAISGLHQSERDMLRELVELITIRDPDVIEGHNIYNFDLPYLARRCEIHGVDFAIGREGALPRHFDSRMAFAERVVEYTSFEIPGRQIIDTWLLLQSYDASKRTLESYGLKNAAKHFGFAKEDRIYVSADRIAWYWDNEPDLLIRYALDDVEETRLLSDQLSPSTFYLTQMLPFNYGTVARLGASSKIEALLLREYIRQRHSIPAPEVGSQTTGGYTDIFYTGVLGPILNVDVESLYPSLILAENITPKHESLGVFIPLLQHLTSQRLAAKRRMKSASTAEAFARHDAFQASMKSLINSFYGYLGYGRALFNDVSAADRVTQKGQTVLRDLITTIEGYGGMVIEVDTDGIYFVPPNTVVAESEELSFVERAASILPYGLSLASSGRFRRMLSYKKKNYALLGYDNRTKVKGSSLISRNMEKFGRHFIQQCVDALLNNDIAGLHHLYTNLWNDISEHRLQAADFARTETLKDTPDEYWRAVENGSRNRSASYEVMLAAGRSWRSGDRVSYYVTGNDPNSRGFENCRLAEEWDAGKPDENALYYIRRLDEVAQKFEVFFTAPDFRRIFSNDDLFGFSPEGITILTKKVPRETALLSDEDPDYSLRKPRLELDTE